MAIINSKAETKELVAEALGSYGQRDFIKQLHVLLLKKKVRFPMLEYAASEICKSVPEKEQLAVSDAIIELQETGGNVMAGMILQMRLKKHFGSALQKAVEYIILGDAWYVCDIIGERVMGYALLTDPKKTIPALKRLTKHDNKWIVRSVGVAAHYAVKKGLTKQHSEQVFQILLLCSGTTDFHTKKGIGWAAKTIAKFHPDIIKLHEELLQNDPQIKQWFKTKVRIGLGRSFKYAARYNS